MPKIPAIATLSGTVDGSNRVFTATMTSPDSINYATYDGTQHRQGDVDGFTVDLTTGTVTFNFAPQNPNYQPWLEYLQLVPDATGGIITGTLNTSGGGDDIRLTRGQDITWSIAWTTDAGPIDLTGVLGLYLTVKRQLIDGFPALIQKTLASGITVSIPATLGLSQVTFAPADTMNLDEGRYMYDKWIITSSGFQYPAGSGAFIIEGRGTVLP